MNFDQCVEIILSYEKGWVDHPEDPGGATNFGISQRSYPNLDIKNLTRDQAIAIYKKDYWDRARIESVPDRLKLLVFDCAVNQGVGTAAKFYELSKNQAHPLEAFVKLRMQKYQNHPKWAVFGAGWSNRLLDVTLKSVA